VFPLLHMPTKRLDLRDQYVFSSKG